MKLRDLREKRGKLAAKMKAIYDQPANGADMSDDQAAEFDRLETEVRALDTSIARAEKLDDIERRMHGTPLTGDLDRTDQQFEDNCRAFSIRAAIAHAIAHITGVRVDAGRELETSQELARRSGQQPKGILVPLNVFEKRIVTTALPAGGPGSNIIATDHRGDLFIDILRAKLIVMQLGATVLRDLRGNIDIPKLAQSAVAEWIAENTALSGSTPEFDKITMSPKHVGCMTEVSRNMILQSSPDIEQLLRNDFSRVLAEAIDRVALKGGGANEPDGILETPGIGQVDMQSGPTWGDVLELIADVETSNSEGNGFATSPRVVSKLRRTSKVTSTDSVMIMESPDTLAGYPLRRSMITTENGSPAGDPLIFGFWPDLLIGYWGGLDILVNPFADSVYAKGNILIRGLLSADVDVRHPESFSAATEVGLAP